MLLLLLSMLILLLLFILLLLLIIVITIILDDGMCQVPSTPLQCGVLSLEGTVSTGRLASAAAVPP